MSDVAPQPAAPAERAADDRLSAEVEIANMKGLHARASAKFAALAERYEAEITVSRDDMAVNGTSIMGLLMLAAAKGSVIELTAVGQEASAALSALIALVENRFDEGE